MAAETRSTMAVPDAETHPRASDPPVISTVTTGCCIVGGGPAGAMLALLLARQGVPVTLLEEHRDFARDFRGDTIHPSVLQIMSEIGLADRLLELPHTEAHNFTLPTAAEQPIVIDFHRLKTDYPFVMMLPQERFLPFVVEEARRYPTFRLVMGARVEKLIEEEGKVRGVVYRAQDGWHAVRARLTVGADGRFSRVRRLAGFEPQGNAPPIDVLWFRVPRRPGDSAQSGGRIARGTMLVLLNRGDYWQIAYIIPKGHYQQVHAAGLERLRQAVGATAPELADRLDTLRDWKQVAVLSVESSHLPRWYKPGLLLIGDAAHVMSPVGGVGINYAIQDAVVAANILGPRFKAGPLRLRDLAAVQRQRAWPTRFIQAAQGFLQEQVIREVQDHRDRAELSAVVRLVARLSILRQLMARLIGFGLVQVHVKTFQHHG